MGMAAAKAGDEIRAIDTHDVILPTPPGGTARLPHIFAGVIDDELSSDVRINGKAAAMAGSTASNDPHKPTPPGIGFVNRPKNVGTIEQGSGTVRINGMPAARNGDPAMTCNDPADTPAGRVLAFSNVRIG